MRKANFFIVGAPKCGTTALSYYLRNHPQVFMTLPKEPGFFSRDFPGLQYVKTLEEYEQLFRQAPEDAVAIGEASPRYLHSRVALGLIHEYNPSARLIVMLRNPVEMLRSYHAQLVYSKIEDQVDLETAWHLQEARSSGLAIPTWCREPSMLQYRNVVSLGDHLERLYQIFCRDQVMVILYDDFKRNPLQVYRRVLSFLGLKDDGRKDFPPVNSAKAARWNWLNDLLHTPPPWALNCIRRLAGTKLHDWIVSAHGRFSKLNSVAKPPPALSIAMREDLVSELNPQIEKLERLLGRSLGEWTNHPAQRIPNRGRKRK